MSLFVAQLFAESLARFPDRPAIWCEGKHYSYSELATLASSILGELQKRGLDRAPRIGVATGTDVHTYASILAILCNGSAYVPINEKSPKKRNIAVLESADVAAVLVSRNLPTSPVVQASLACELPVIHSTSVSIEASNQSIAALAVEEHQLAYLFFTSGSTGTPKGVPISHANLGSFMEVMLNKGIYSWSEEDRFLQMFELTFDLSVMSLFLPLAVGGCCYVVPESRLGHIATLKVLQDQEITVALMVPSLCAYLEDYLDHVELPSLRLSLFCGEALLDELAMKWSRAAVSSRLENVYGPTEATIFCLRYVWSEKHSGQEAVNGIVPIGKAWPGMKASVVDKNGKLAGDASIKGELVLLGDQVVKGYWRDPERTARAFISLNGEPAYRTGDVCFKNENEDFIYCGRLDSQVQVDGHRVEIGEAEHATRRVLRRSKVAIVPLTQKGKTTLELVLEEPRVDWKETRTALAEEVPSYMIPYGVSYVPALPLNLNGKVDRPKLKKMIENGEV